MRSSIRMLYIVVNSFLPRGSDRDNQNRLLQVVNNDRVLSKYVEQQHTVTDTWH